MASVGWRPAAIGIIVVGAASGASDQRAQNLRVIIGAEPPSLDPGLATDTTSSNVLLNINEPLIKLGAPPDLNAVPGAAQSWTVKGSTVTLNLRKDVRWSNGQPVTAQDYVWSWLRTLSPELAADYAYQLWGIKGAEAYNGCKSNCNARSRKVGLRARPVLLRIQLVSAQRGSSSSCRTPRSCRRTRRRHKYGRSGRSREHGHERPVQAPGGSDASVTLVKNTSGATRSRSS
jgi:hypothetical protein